MRRREQKRRKNQNVNNYQKITKIKKKKTTDI